MCEAPSDVEVGKSACEDEGGHRNVGIVPNVPRDITFCEEGPDELDDEQNTHHRS